MTSLFGQTAIITGGSRGLGYAIAESLAAEGADIALLDIRPQVEESAARLAADSGRSVIGIVCNVADPDSIDGAFHALRVTRPGGGPASVLVNAAGIASGTPAIDVSLGEWSRVIDVNLTGTFLMCQRFARELIAAEATGSIVNIASMSGLVVNVPQPQAAYNTSKAGVSMLTKSLAIEWLPAGIRVNAIAPGYFESDLIKDRITQEPEMVQQWLDRTPAGRMGQPPELGPLVVYLCSEAASFVVGQTISIDGGYTIV